MNGVMIGEKHNYRDFGLILSSKVISPPEPQTKFVAVPLRDGSLDLTESLTGDVRYKDRPITMTFTVIDPVNMWSARVSEVQNYLHGKKFRITFDDDCAFYYVGRVAVNEWKSQKGFGTLVIEGTCEPYKYDVQSTSEEWLWDVFDFEIGYIHEASNVVVDGQADIVIIGKRKQTYLTITASAEMTMEFEGMTYIIKEGTQKLYDVILPEGENMLIFRGNGTVTVDYIGGSL